MFPIKKVFQEILTNMKPKILVTRKISDAAEEKLNINFEVTLNPKDEPIPLMNLLKWLMNMMDLFQPDLIKLVKSFLKI